MTRRRVARLDEAATYAILLAGVLLRLSQFAANRSLWHDEAALALDIVQRSFAQLLQPLDYNQAAPCVFLFIQRVLILVLGNHDYVLRLFPLVSGILALTLFSHVARLHLTGIGKWVALSLFAFSDKLVYYASEAKQYSSDVCVTVLLLWGAGLWLKARHRPRASILFIMGGAVSLWLSHPAVFVLAAIGTGLAIHHLRQRDWQSLTWLAGAAGVWLASFALLYEVSLRALAASTVLTSFWNAQFMPMPPWRNIAWFQLAYTGLLSYMLLGGLGLTRFAPAPALLTAAAGGLALLAGAVAVLVKKGPRGLGVVLPFIFALAASGLQKYPFGDRLLLFTAPLVFLLIGAGVEQLQLCAAKLDARLSVGASLVVAAALLLDPAAIALPYLQQPRQKEEIKPVLAYLAQHRQPPDQISIYYGAEPAFRYYAPQYGLAGSGYVFSESERQQPERYLQALDKLNGQGRIWFVLAHDYPYCDKCGSTRHEVTYCLNHLDGEGTRLDEFTAPGASVYLYDLRGTAPR